MIKLLQTCFNLKMPCFSTSWGSFVYLFLPLILIRSCPSYLDVTPRCNKGAGVCFHLDLLGCPLVQIDRFDSGDVDAEVTVDPGAADAHEHPEVPGSPSRT